MRSSCLRKSAVAAMLHRIGRKSGGLIELSKIIDFDMHMLSQTPRPTVRALHLL